MSSFRGLYTSLYDSLPVDAIQDIERAIWHKMSGQGEDARAIFDCELKAYRSFSVVVIERADLELETGRWGAAWRILDSALRDLKEANADLDHPENRLMGLTWAMLGTRHRGDLASAAVEIERTQDWLRDVPVTDYTDIQVLIHLLGCLLVFVDIRADKLHPKIRDSLSIRQAEFELPSSKHRTHTHAYGRQQSFRTRSMLGWTGPTPQGSDNTRQSL